MNWHVAEQIFFVTFFNGHNVTETLKFFYSSHKRVSGRYFLPSGLRHPGDARAARLAEKYRWSRGSVVCRSVQCFTRCPLGV